MRYVFAIGALLLCANAHAQELHMSQFYNTPLFMNPATAGDFTGQLRLGTQYRDQWNMIGKGYESYLVSADVAYMDPNESVQKENVPGAGINIYRDRQGDFKFGRLSIGLNVADHLTLANKSKLSFGLMLGMGKTSMEMTGLQWGSQYDGEQYNGGLPGEDMPLQSKTYFDSGAGVQWEIGSTTTTLSAKDEKWIKLGVSAFHLNRPRDNAAESSISRVPVRYNFYLTSRIGLRNTTVSLEPMLTYARHTGAQEILFGTLIAYQTKESSRYTEYIKASEVGMGLHYRVGDAFIPSIFYNMSNLKLSIGYDVTVSSLHKAVHSGGGMEVSLKYIFFRLDK